MKYSGTGFLIALLLLGLANPGLAQLVPPRVEQNQLDQANPGRELPAGPQTNGRISERQAVNLARQKFAGNILRISLVGEGANQRFQIRMENEGKVFTVFVHATTGRVSGGS